ncbi:hypothetical protein P4H94_01130 [Paenibacillus macerans]|uniref:Uncharacterized protein n=1 Tax=Paenibacillus macerans TaxID=44252 RepID=A0A090ZNG1_PAEMA|nr:hypothetical protein [Paenibacillus macerans]KFN05696.1 hypothetical protein DJ90_178 [Paenibacillus macerans]MBS5910069.1 hypothetical protein [Paenibacillus macerans]MCY7560135.1 hypothetical protein [Paenibacillus macerans]MDU5946409.1 hypothetical protein [Paenibacillus macerans]MEC0135503.1 hypothetical protein [Paenibacillus macerans]
MDKKVKRYYQLKQQQKEAELEMAELRSEILKHCLEQGAAELEIGNYRVKTVIQERKEYDDQKLYEALPDPEVWRLISKADAQKVAGLIKLNVIPEERLKDTYATKRITLLQVEKK